MSANGWFGIVDRLTSMQAFAKTVELGSLTAAATAMGISPQMVGKHVGALEERLGTQLLRRTTRRQSLTETGQAFYERCRVILAEIETAEALARDLGASPRGRLRIGAPVNYGASKVAKWRRW
jgi:DNA-binding transcriptional LysR family regulator